MSRFLLAKILQGRRRGCFCIGSVAFLPGGRSQGAAAVRLIWSGRVDACLLPAQHGYLADSQDWDTVLILEYPAGARLRPEELGKEVAKDRFWLELLPDQATVTHVATTSLHSAGDQCSRPAPVNSHSIHSARCQDSALSQQLSDWAQHTLDSPVHAVSLLRLSPSSSSDSASRNQGVAVPDLAADGGSGARRVLAAGVVKDGGEFDQGCWDAVSIVEYSSRAALRDALMSEAQKRQCADAAVFALHPSDIAAAKL